MDKGELRIHQIPVARGGIQSLGATGSCVEFSSRPIAEWVLVLLVMARGCGVADGAVGWLTGLSCFTNEWCLELAALGNLEPAQGRVDISAISTGGVQWDIF